jgi:hypothetical protein
MENYTETNKVAEKSAENREAVYRSETLTMEELLQSPPVNNYMKRQIQLAADKFKLENPGVELTHPMMTDLVMKWAEDGSEYSPAFRELSKNPLFSEHIRFRGNYANITIEDVEFYIKNKRLPEA